MSEKELRICQLSLLDRFAEYCCTHELTWFLAAGTLLGAVRHSGFIPWDDDIDVMMPRSEFNRFLALSVEDDELNAQVCSYLTTPKYPFPYAKVADSCTVMRENYVQEVDYGVNIDVFPIDQWRENRVVRSMQRLAAFVIQRFIFIRYSPPNEERSKFRAGVVGLFQPIARLVKAESFAKLLTWVATNDDLAASHSGIIVWPGAEYAPAAAFMSATQLEFEGRELPAPSGYHQILRAKYGSYEVPPLDRSSAHSFTPYWRSADRSRRGR